MMEPIKPCPFCGISGNLHSSSMSVWMECDSCGAATAKFQSEEAARDCWNMRYQQAPTPKWREQDAARFQFIADGKMALHFLMFLTDECNGEMDDMTIREIIDRERA